MRPTWCHVGLARRGFRVRRPELEAVEARCLLAGGIGASAASVSALPAIQFGPELSPEVVAGDAFSNLVLADFFTSLPDASATDFTATINWGDGSSGTGTVVAAPVVGPGGPEHTFTSTSPVWESLYVVEGSHTYANAGKYTIEVTITSSLGAAANVSTTANVVSPPTPIVTPVQPVVGQSHPSGTTNSSGTKGSQKQHHATAVHHPRTTVKIHTSAHPRAAHHGR